jgi:hypothetical protein
MANISKMIHGYLFLQQQQQQQKYSRHNTKSSQVVNFEVKLNTNPNLVVQIEEHYLCLKCIFFILLSLLGGLSVLFYLILSTIPILKLLAFNNEPLHYFLIHVNYAIFLIQDNSKEGLSHEILLQTFTGAVVAVIVW